jgi:hypothetical protein
MKEEKGVDLYHFLSSARVADSFSCKIADIDVKSMVDLERQEFTSHTKRK